LKGKQRINPFTPIRCLVFKFVVLFIAQKVNNMNTTPLIITSAPDIMGGTPVFSGTRVPVDTFLDYLKGGESIDDFLEGFPTVSKEQIIAFLEEIKTQMLKKAA